MGQINEENTRLEAKLSDINDRLSRLELRATECSQSTSHQSPIELRGSHSSQFEFEFEIVRQLDALGDKISDLRTTIRAGFQSEIWAETENKSENTSWPIYICKKGTFFHYKGCPNINAAASMFELCSHCKRKHRL